MKFSTTVISVSLLAASSTTTTDAFAPRINSPSVLPRTTNYVAIVEDIETTAENELTSAAAIKSLTYRELQTHCKNRGLQAVGTTAVLRERLMEDAGLCQTKPMSDECDVEDDVVPAGIVFEDDSDPDFDFNDLNDSIAHTCSLGHWKKAVRQLRKLRRRHATPTRPVPRDTYVRVLEVCAEGRSHGARASESARKIIEEMADAGYDAPETLVNDCVLNCLGEGPHATHDGFGGVDPALAMLSAASASKNEEGLVRPDTYGAVVSALAKDGAVEDALVLLRAVIVDQLITPSLSVFADVAAAAAKVPGAEADVMLCLSLVKAAGYELDTVGSTEAGRSVLASGIIAAERTDNLSLALRLLTAAGKAEGCAPDRGDDLVASSSAAAQRACTLVHKRAIDKAVQENSWKLAVKILSLMPRRSLTPSTSVWRKVVNVCAKAEKSRRATALLFDWIKISESSKVEKPPVNVFNTVINTCEICGEEELTQTVLDAMRKTHDIDGNLITFNIAIKRLAKLGAARACEGIVIGMLQSGNEPNVVTYTTAIGACVGAKDPAFAVTWLDRMRSRNVTPNKYTYNTALAACLTDPSIESTRLASKVAADMLADVERELDETNAEGSTSQFRSALPDTYTKLLARNVMKQLRENWRAGDIDMGEAKSTLRVPLLKLVDFNKSEAAERVRERMDQYRAEGGRSKKEDADEDADETADDDEMELEYKGVSDLHKSGSRVAEI